jgi:hypothetical protein
MSPRCLHNSPPMPAEFTDKSPIQAVPGRASSRFPLLSTPQRSRCSDVISGSWHEGSRRLIENVEQCALFWSYQMIGRLNRSLPIIEPRAAPPTGDGLIGAPHLNYSSDAGCSHDSGNRHGRLLIAIYGCGAASTYFCSMYGNVEWMRSMPPGLYSGWMIAITPPETASIWSAVNSRTCRVLPAICLPIIGLLLLLCRQAACGSQVSPSSGGRFKKIEFVRTTRINDSLKEFKKQLNLAVSIFLFLIVGVVVFAAGKLAWTWWTSF